MPAPVHARWAAVASAGGTASGRQPHSAALLLWPQNRYAASYPTSQPHQRFQNQDALDPASPPTHTHTPRAFACVTAAHGLASFPPDTTPTSTTSEKSRGYSPTAGTAAGPAGAGAATGAGAAASCWC